MKNSKLFFGLGNPELKYRNTRHQMGCKVLDAFRIKFKTTLVEHVEGQYDLYAYEHTVDGEKCVDYLCYPLTGMNSAGDVLPELSKKLEIENPEQLIVFYDDIHLEPGCIRVKKMSENHGGHNGVKSVLENFGPGWIACKIGVGSPADKSKLLEWVIGQMDFKSYVMLIHTCILFVPLIENFRSYADMAAIQSAFNGMRIVCEDETTYPQSQS